MNDLHVSRLFSMLAAPCMLAVAVYCMLHYALCQLDTNCSPMAAFVTINKLTSERRIVPRCLLLFHYCLSCPANLYNRNSEVTDS